MILFLLKIPARISRWVTANFILARADGLPSFKLPSGFSLGFPSGRIARWSRFVFRRILWFCLVGVRRAGSRTAAKWYIAFNCAKEISILTLSRAAMRNLLPVAN